MHEGITNAKVTDREIRELAQNMSGLIEYSLVCKGEIPEDHTDYSVDIIKDRAGIRISSYWNGNNGTFIIDELVPSLPQPKEMLASRRVELLFQGQEKKIIRQREYVNGIENPTLRRSTYESIQRLLNI